MMKKNNVIKIIASAVIFATLFIHALILKSCAIDRFIEGHKEYEQKLRANENIFTMPQDVVVNDVKITDADSIVKIYKEISERLKETERLVKNYQTDANIVIVRANHCMEIWLGVSSALIALFSIFVVLNNYFQEKSIKEELRDKKNELEKELEKLAKKNEKLIKEQKNKLVMQTRISKVNSIMSCLGSFPDPLLSSGVDKKRYAGEYLSILCDEFERYVNNIGQEKTRTERYHDNNNNEYIEYINNAQIIVSGIYAIIVRTQCLYPNIRQNVYFLKFADMLEYMINSFIYKDINRNNIVDKLNELCLAFKQFNAVVVNGY